MVRVFGKSPRDEYRDCHLEEARRMLGDLTGYLQETREKQAEAGAAGRHDEVEYWRLCYAALCDMFIAAIPPDYNAYQAANMQTTLAYYALGFRDDTEEERQEQEALYNEANRIAEQEWRNTPSLTSSDQGEDIPF